MVLSVVYIRRREGGSGRGRGASGDTLLYFLQAFTVLARDARMQEAVISNFWNKHWLQMNEAVVRFNLLNARRYATFGGLHGIYENKAKP